MSSPIGGFFPIPLAMMIPFMATQSLIMGDAFGRSFQYGKRKISAMSNEEFNDLTTEKIAQQIFAEYKNIIPSLNQALIDSQELQKKVVDELLSLPSNFLADVWDNIANPNKKDTSFIPNSNNPADSRTWAPGWSPSQEQDFNPPAGAPQPSPTPQQPAPISRRTESGQQLAEKALVLQLKAKVTTITNKLTPLLKIRASMPTATARDNSVRASHFNTHIRPLKVQLTQAGLNYSKKAQEYKNKYGVWL